MNSFYKVIILNIDIFESDIIDERHFSNETEARAYIEETKITGTIGIIVKM